MELLIYVQTLIAIYYVTSYQGEMNLRGLILLLFIISNIRLYFTDLGLDKSYNSYFFGFTILCSLVFVFQSCRLHMRDK